MPSSYTPAGSGIDQNAVAITGGTITGTPISGSTGAFMSFGAGGFYAGNIVTQIDDHGNLVVGRPGAIGANARIVGTLSFGSSYASTLGMDADNTLALRNSTADQTLSLGAASGTGGGVLVLNTSASAPSPITGQAQFYALSGGEGYGMDGSGNQTLLTPHATDAPGWLYEVGPGADHLERKVNVYFATVKFWNVDRERHLHAQHLISVGFGPTGTPEESKAAWDEVIARRASGRLLCEHEETFAEYKARTGNSLIPAGQDKDWWMTHSPVERQQKVEADRVAKSQGARDAWTTRKDAFVATEEIPTFTEPEPSLYVAAPTPLIFT